MPDVILKRCATCGIEKDITLFVKCKTKGYRSPCKACVNLKNHELRKTMSEENKVKRSLNQKAWRLRNLEHRRAMEKIYRDRDVGRNEYNKAYSLTDAGKIRRKIGSDAYKKRNPLKRSAHIKLNNAIRLGFVTKMPCSVCQDAKSHGHHEDYSLPLEVIWYCRKHHLERHREMKRLGITFDEEGKPVRLVP